MRKYAEKGDIVQLPQADLMDWPSMLVEDVYDKQIAEKKIVRMVLVVWFDKTHNLHRGEFVQDLLLVVEK